MTTVRVSVRIDGSIYQASPSKPYSAVSYLTLRGGTTDLARALLFATLAIPPGATVTSAWLRLRARGAWPAVAGRTIQINNITGTWVASTVTYNTAPTSASGVTVPVAGAYADGAEIALPITSVAQRWASGAVQRGLQLSLSENARRLVHSGNAADPSLWPVLEVTWSDAPEPPSGVRPADGRVVSNSKPLHTFVSNDYGGDRTIGEVRVQIASSSTGFGAPTWDSGWRPWSTPDAPIDDWGYPGAAAGSTVWSRIATKDGGGQPLESGWSAPVSWAYRALGTLTLVSPTGGVIYDPSVPIQWTFTGATQRAYAIRVYRTDQARPLYDTGRVTSTATSFTLPSGIITSHSLTYRIELFVWDTYDRETAGDALTYAFAQAVVTFGSDAGVAPVTNLQASSLSPLPDVYLHWTRSVAADSYQVLRASAGGARTILKTLTAAQAQDPSGGFHTTMHGQPKGSWSYSVVALVNGRASSRVTAPAVQSAPHGVWLIDAINGGTERVCLSGLESLFSEESEDVEVDYAHGARYATVRRFGRIGRAGRIDHELKKTISHPTQDTTEAAKLIERWKAIPRPIVLMAGSVSVTVNLVQLNCSPTGLWANGQPTFHVTAEWYEADPKDLP